MARARRQAKELLPIDDDITAPPTDSAGTGDDDKTIVQKSVFVPVLMQFRDGFWCSRLQRSFMPGNYMAQSEQEVDALLPFAVKK